MSISPQPGVVTFTYNKTQATRWVLDYADMYQTGETSVAIRVVLGEIHGRILTNIHGMAEAIGILFTVQNRALSPAYNRCSNIRDCILYNTGGNIQVGGFKGIRSPRAFDPLCQNGDSCQNAYGVTRKDQAIKAVDYAAIALKIVRNGLLADFTQGADSFVHRCGGNQYNQYSDNCKGNPNESIGPLVFYKCNYEYCEDTAFIDCEIDEGVFCPVRP